MKLSLSKRGDYVLRSAIYLAHAYGNDGARKLRQVSDETGIPRTFVSQILGDLVHAGVAASSLGTHGGYRLARPPGEITLLDVVEAGEGSLGSTGCPAAVSSCPWRSSCPLRETWASATTLVRAVLADTTLDQLAGSAVDHGVRVASPPGDMSRARSPMSAPCGRR